MTERKYTASHEWIAVEDGTATIGITDFAQAQLGDVVFLELPKAGAKVTAGESFGVIESVKAASDLYCPASGDVLEVNPKLEKSPDLVNSDPYGEGWLIKVRVDGAPEGLLSESEYAATAAAGH
ncbi:MAG TPA: glycine cleavage system protein GcvH [Candidatus Dormibacteraeota bacterium]|nr:glycine cleavage system protein GcvH [Candidatus Dormibacteraeota bacterium]